MDILENRLKSIEKGDFLKKELNAADAAFNQNVDKLEEMLDGKAASEHVHSAQDVGAIADACIPILPTQNIGVNRLKPNKLYKTTVGGVISRQYGYPVNSSSDTVIIRASGTETHLIYEAWYLVQGTHWTNICNNGVWRGWDVNSMSTSNIAMGPGWSNVGCGFDMLRVTRIGRTATLSGVLKCMINPTNGSIIATIPQEYLPPVNGVTMSVGVMNTGVFRFDIRYEGTVQFIGVVAGTGNYDFVGINATWYLPYR